MSRGIKNMQNLGPAMERMLAEVGIYNEQSLTNIGAVDAYHRLKFRFGQQINIVALYAMEASLQNRNWRSLSNAEKLALQSLTVENKAT